MEITLFSLHKTKQELLGNLQGKDIVEVSHNIKNISRYYEHYNVTSINTNKKNCILSFPREELSIKISSHHDGTFKFIYQNCSDIMCELEAEKNIVLKVEWVLKKSPENFPSIIEVSKVLSVSHRTLSRRLKEQGVKFQDLLTKERFNRAEKMIVANELTMSEISNKLKFYDLSAFSKFFYRVAKISPTAYREQSLRR